MDMAFRELDLLSNNVILCYFIIMIHQYTVLSSCSSYPEDHDLVCYTTDMLGLDSGNWFGHELLQVRGRKVSVTNAS